MKPIVILVSMIVLMTVTSADAQFRRCNRPSEPFLFLDPWSASYSEMQFAEIQVDLYLNQMRAYIDCLADEVEAADRERARVLEDWNLQVNLFNSR